MVEFLRFCQVTVSNILPLVFCSVFTVFCNNNTLIENFLEKELRNTQMVGTRLEVLDTKKHTGGWDVSSNPPPVTY